MNVSWIAILYDKIHAEPWKPNALEPKQLHGQGSYKKKRVIHKTNSSFSILKKKERKIKLIFPYSIGNLDKMQNPGQAPTKIASADIAQAGTVAFVHPLVRHF